MYHVLAKARHFTTNTVVCTCYWDAQRTKTRLAKKLTRRLAKEAPDAVTEIITSVTELAAVYHPECLPTKRRPGRPRKVKPTTDDFASDPFA